jgi:hypothetical protein
MRAGVLQICFLVQVMRVENERFSLGIENAAVSFVRLRGFGNVVNFGDVQGARLHQFPDFAVGVQQFLLFRNPSLLLVECSLSVVHALH